MIAIGGQFEPGFTRFEDFQDLLDGENALKNTLVLATTNFPEKLPANLVERCSRFDKLVQLRNLTRNDCKSLLTAFLKRAPTIDEVNELPINITISALKEICLLMMTHKISLNESSERIAKQLKIAKENFAEEKKIGFNNDSW